MDKLYDPSHPLARLLASVEKDEESRFGDSRSLKSVSTRVDLIDACKIDALAAVSGESRSYILENLILSGLAEVLSNLSKESLSRFHDSLESEFKKNFPDVVPKVEAFRDEPGFISNQELEVYEFIQVAEATRMLSKQAEKEAEKCSS